MASLKYDIFAVDKTTKAFQSVKKNLDAIDKKFKKIQNSAKGIGGALLTAFAGATIKNIIDATDKIQKFSIRLGITTEELSRLKFAGEQTGISFNQLTSGLQRMTRRISEAATGSGTATKALQELGLNATDLNKLSPDQQFNKIADALHNVTNQADKVRIGFKLFDSEGVALIQTMKGGSQSVEELKNELSRLGGEVTQNQADALSNLNDSWNRLKTAFMGLARFVLETLEPAFTLFIDAIAELTTFITKTVKTILLFYDAMAALLGTVGEFFGLLDEGVKKKTVDNLTEKWDDVWESTKRAKRELKDYKREMGNIFDDNTIKQTGKAKTGTVGSPDKITESMQQSFEKGEHAAGRSMGRIKDTFKDGITTVIKDFDSFGDVVKSSISKIGDILLQNQLDQVFSSFGSGKPGGLFSGVSGMFGNVLNPSSGANSAISGLFSGIGNIFGGFFANGGNFSGGRPIMVGERGPEMIVPRNSGTVIPNHELQGDNISIVMNVNTPDTQTFRQSQPQLTVEMANQIEIAKKRNM